MIAVSACGITGNAAAQMAYPEKPIRIIVGFPPGSQTDTVTRLFNQKLAESLAKPFVIENITGAAGNIAAERVAKATPDGYTLGLLSQGQLVVNPSLYRLAFDPAKDFAPVSQVYMFTPILVIHNGVPAKSIKELIALAKAHPGELSFASAGSGSAQHMAAEFLKSAAGIDILHIPYKGGVAAIPDLLGGRVTMMFGSTGAFLPMVREGKLRVLAVTSLRRLAAAPEWPTIAESGYPGFEITAWNGLLAPARTPSAIVHKLHLESAKALALPDLRGKLGDLGLEGIGNSPEVFAAVIKSEFPKWAKVIRESGIRPD